MTKRLIASVCLIAVSLSVGILSFIYIKNASAEIISAAEAMEEKNLAGEDFSAEYEHLAALGEHYLPFFAVILKHSEADTIQKYFITLGDALQTPDAARISVILSELCAFIEVTIDGEKPCAENIF